jgi:hypothetical protein
VSATVPYFGKAWKLTVTPQATGEEWTVSASQWEPEALRCTFRIEQLPLARWWTADIVITNFLPALAPTIKAGDAVSVTAGYQNPGSGVIFQGVVFQPLWERANETDYTLTLHCLVGLWDQNGPTVSTVIPANLSPANAVALVAQAGGVPIDYIDPSLASAPANPRGTSFAGPASLYFAQTAATNAMNFWMSWKGVVIRSLAPQGSTPDVIYAPPYAPATAASGATKYTLIGTPEQVEDGLMFRVLLDYGASLGQLVQISSAVFKKLALYPGQKVFIDPDGIYVVVGITHRGDTRGNEWYTEIHGATRALAKMNAVMAF